MDKLRALQYFVAAAAEGSFSKAARRMEVSMPAVLKLINALERSLGSSLFDRSFKGLALTPEGARYLDRCRPLLEELEDAGSAVGPVAGPRGVVAVGMAPFESHCIGPALPQFHARFPDIELDIRTMHRVTEAQAATVDVFVMTGWEQSPELVRKVVCRTPYCIVASPAYWTANGVPQRPQDLQGHACLIFRSVSVLLDVWEFERGDELESVTVKGWLASASREILLDAALAGAGVMRARDLTARPHIAAGRLVAALQDWNAKQAPSVSIYFRPKHRRTARIRSFVDFVAEVFHGLESEPGAHWPIATARPPGWWGTRYGRASSADRGRR